MGHLRLSPRKNRGTNITYSKVARLNQLRDTMSHQSPTELKTVLSFHWTNPALKSRLLRSCPHRLRCMNLSWANPQLIMFRPPSRQDDCLKNQKSCRTSTTRPSMQSLAELSKNWCLRLKRELIMFKHSLKKASHPQKSNHMEVKAFTTLPSKMWTRAYWSPWNKNE